MTHPKLHVAGVSRRFSRPGGQVVEALAPVDLAVGSGEFVSIIGPSGCGKSTLFNIISGLLEATAGHVLIDGTQPRPLLGAVGLMPQRDLLMPWRSVLDNVALGLTLAGRMSRKEARKVAQGYFEEFGLSGYERSWPAQLSGGMRQRAALLRTFLTGHEVILLDEPFGALDALTRRSMQTWLLNVWEARKSTILFVTHDVDEAVLLSDRVYAMAGRPGRIALDLRIELPRPRTSQLQLTAQFADYKRRLMEPLEQGSAT